MDLLVEPDLAVPTGKLERSWAAASRRPSTTPRAARSRRRTTTRRSTRTSSARGPGRVRRATGRTVDELAGRARRPEERLRSGYS